MGTTITALATASLGLLAVSTNQPWSGRALHFVGIGGAGMSGLALVARSLGATVTGSDRVGAGRPTWPAAGARGRAGRGPRRRQRARGGRGRRLQRDPAGEPRARDRPRARPARAAPRRAARRADAAQADDRDQRHPRQDDDLEHGRARAARLRDGSELPGRRRGALDRGQRGLGDGGVARGRGRRVRPLAAEALAADRRADQRRARPPHDLQLAPRRRRHLPRVPRRSPSRRSSGTARSCSRSPATPR